MAEMQEFIDGATALAAVLAAVGAWSNARRIDGGGGSCRCARADGPDGADDDRSRPRGVGRGLRGMGLVTAGVAIAAVVVAALRLLG